MARRLFLSAIALCLCSETAFAQAVAKPFPKGKARARFDNAFFAKSLGRTGGIGEAVSVKWSTSIKKHRGVSIQFSQNVNGDGKTFILKRTINIPAGVTARTETFLPPGGTWALPGTYKFELIVSSAILGQPPAREVLLMHTKPAGGPGGGGPGGGTAARAAAAGQVLIHFPDTSTDPTN